MPIKNSLRLACLLLALLLPLSALGAGSTANQKNIVITMPAETVLASLQKILPLDIPPQNRQVQGTITLESVDRLVIRNNIISLRGVLSGRNLVVVTHFGGQDIQLRIGEVRLPMTCDLHTRFDPAKRKLFVTPRFSEAATNHGTPEDALTPLIGALGGREYPVDLDALQLINLNVGARSIPIAMQPVDIAGLDNALIFHLQPRIGAAR